MRRPPWAAPRWASPRGRALICLVLGVILAGVIAPATAAVPEMTTSPVTYPGHAYPSTVVDPTADKPQSKLWFTDGSWWSLMISGSDGLNHIFELMPDHSWRDTGTLVDSRSSSTGDALWDGARLYVASRQASSPLRVNRFTYDPGSRGWSTDSGFPVSVGPGGSESAAIDKDSTGRLWVTFTRKSKVWVAHSTTSDGVWTAAFNPNVPDVSIASDDISSLISFGGNIGVLWSDQASDVFRFAVHPDGADDRTWQLETALAGFDMADDHVNLKTLTGDEQGRVFAAIKTGQGDHGQPASSPSVAVLSRSTAGVWSFDVAGTIADDLTRPIIIVDSTNQELYFLATDSIGGGTIRYKKTGLSNIFFPTGRGEPFVDWPGRKINNVTGSKQSVTSDTGLVVLAADRAGTRYYHAELKLAGATTTPPEDTLPPTVPANVTATATSPTAVNVAWSPSSDAVGVASYTVRRDGAVVASTETLSHADTGLIADTTYSYTISATDAAGNESAESAAVTVTTPEPGTQVPITLRAATSAANGGAASLTLPTPEVIAGDVLVAAVSVRGKPVITPPQGWQLVRQDLNGTTLEQALYVRVASGEEPSSYTWGFSASVSAVGSALSYSGVSTTDPIEAHGGQANAASTLITAPSVSVSTAGTMLVGIFGSVGWVGITEPSGTVERTERQSPAEATYKITAATADQVVSSPGLTGPREATSTHLLANTGQLLALRPAAGTD